MPLNNPAPNFGLLTSIDMTGQSGETVFTRSGGSDVDLPNYASGQGYYEDMLFFLNGRGVDASFKADYQLGLALDRAGCRRRTVPLAARGDRPTHATGAPYPG